MNKVPESILKALASKNDQLVAFGMTVASVRCTKTEGGQSDYVVNVTFDDNSRISQFSNQRYAETLNLLEVGDQLTFGFKRQETKHVTAEQTASGQPYEYKEYSDFVILDVQPGEAPASFEALKNRTPHVPQQSRTKMASTVAARRNTDTPAAAEGEIQTSAFAQTVTAQES